MTQRTLNLYTLDIITQNQHPPKKREEELAVRFIDLGGDGKGPNGLDRCLRCGLATLQSGRSVVVMRCCNLEPKFLSVDLQNDSCVGYVELQA